MLFEWTLFKNPELRHGKLYDCSNLKGHNSVIFDRFLNTLSSYDQETNIYTKATIHFNFGQFFSSPRVWPPPPHGPKKKRPIVHYSQVISKFIVPKMKTCTPPLTEIFLHEFGHHDCWQKDMVIHFLLN